MVKSFLTLFLFITTFATAQVKDSTISKKETPKTPTQFSYSELNQDFEILKNAFIETRVGLWYNTYAQFDSICTVQKGKIKDNMNALEFYKIVAPVVAYTKEGHCFIHTSGETNLYTKQKFTYLPFFVKILEGKVYIINNIDKSNTKGFLVSKINGESIDSVMKIFLSIEPSDGYNITSKHHWIESAFWRYYSYFFPQVKSFTIELINPDTKKHITFKNIPSCTLPELQKIQESIIATVPNYIYKESSNIKIDSVLGIATLTFNTFKKSKYKDGINGFKKLLAQYFNTIKEQKIKHLIIDIRKNEGGTQGMEDHLLSHLINNSYLKYKYVEIPSFNYSFLKYTDDSDNALFKDLTTDFYRNNDGRYLNKKGHYEGDSVNTSNFKGDIYILISGLTFSGGSEFAALAKNHTPAKFVGEETGGGYYGNTSGSDVFYTLPNTKLTGRIPLCKFVVQENDNSIPFGHGVIPDYHIQPTIGDYLKGNDIEMDYTKKLVGQK